MRVAILSFYNGLVDRGVEVWARSLKEKIGDRFEIKILGGEKFGSKINWKIKNYNYWRWLILEHVIATLSVWSKVDVIIPTNGTIQTVVCRLVTWILGKPMVVFGHSGLGADDKFNLLCSPNVFVAFSSFQARWANKYRLPWTKVVVIPHAVDTDIFKPPKKKVKESIILCVAANTPDKRIDLVIEAIKRIPNVEFMAVGKGNQYEFPYSKMPEIYKKAKVFCFVPKPHEAFGLVFLEAMASNLPVITTDDPVRREVVGDAGIYIKNPENSQILANAIKEAMEIRWGVRPRKQAEKFGWDKIVLKYEELFDSFTK